MAQVKALSGRKLVSPKALLLDFGGVIVQTTPIPGWEMKLALHVRTLLGASAQLDTESIAADIRAGCVADSHWKNAMSRPFSPREITHEEFWRDFVAADWPGWARSIVIREARALCRLMGHLRSHRELRDGLLALLDAADGADVPVGIVSNALAGQVHLDFLEERGLTRRFAAEIHSDAVGVRKPNPEMILLATRRLGVDPADAWYVGDNFDRDVLCGQRAGIGGNILMEASGTYDMPYQLTLKPDAIVADPRELLRLFEHAVCGLVA